MQKLDVSSPEVAIVRSAFNGQLNLWERHDRNTHVCMPDINKDDMTMSGRSAFDPKDCHGSCCIVDQAKDVDIDDRSGIDSDNSSTLYISKPY